MTAYSLRRKVAPCLVRHGDSASPSWRAWWTCVSICPNPATCASKWGDDAVFDMVGNLDEWTDDPRGTFVGGFYARATRAGCDARVSSHGASYFDYSTGVRCCGDPI